MSRNDHRLVRACIWSGAIASALLILASARDAEGQAAPKRAAAPPDGLALGFLVTTTPLLGMSAAQEDGFYEAPVAPVSAGGCATPRYEVTRGLFLGLSGCYERIWDTRGPVRASVVTVPAEAAARWWRFSHGGMAGVGRVGYFRRWETGQPDAALVAQGVTYQLGLEADFASSEAIAWRVMALARADFGTFVAGGARVSGADAMSAGISLGIGVEWGRTSTW